MLRTTHKLTAIKSPIPLLLKDKDSSKMIPMYPIPNKSAIATSCVSWHYPTIELILHFWVWNKKLHTNAGGKNLISSDPWMINGSCSCKSCCKNSNSFDYVRLCLVIRLKVTRTRFINRAYRVTWSWRVHHILWIIQIPFELQSHNKTLLFVTPS